MRASYAELLAEKVRREKNRLWKPFNRPQELALASLADELFLGGAAGGGKQLALDTVLPTPSGWTTMGSIAVGDAVFTERGDLCSVLAVHPISIPDVAYRLTFDDGSSIDACADHLWWTFDAREMTQLTRRDPQWRAVRRSKRPSRTNGRASAAFVSMLVARNKANPPPSLPAPTGGIRTTAQIAATLTVQNGARTSHAIPVAAPLVCADVNLPLDPYLLGLWLGDGTTSNGSITSADNDIVEWIRSAGWSVVKWKDKYTWGINGLMTVLRAIGILNNKHVPDVYLRASTQQRLALLQGLMDTDGHARKRGGGVEFTNTNKRIVDAVAELAVSLGSKISVRESRATLYGRDCGPNWHINWSPTYPAFTLPRKLATQTEKPNRRRTVQFHYIVSCERISPVPMRCITVSNPTGLYLVGRSMIPTHNTFTGLGLAVTSHVKTLFLRREAVQLVAVVQALKKIVGRRGKWRGSGHGGTMTLDHRVIELAGCEHDDDREKFQGRDHDLKCVAAGTPIFMADGTWRSVEHVKVGDQVATLQGSRRVARFLRRGRRQCCRLRVGKTSLILALDHAILTDGGWASPTELISTECHDAANRFVELLPRRSGSTLPEWCRSGYLLPGQQHAQRIQAENRFPASAASSVGDRIDCAASGGEPPERERLPLWCGRVVLHEPALQSTERFASCEYPRHARDRARRKTLQRGSRCGCRALFCSCGGQFPVLAREAGRGRIPLPGDAARSGQTVWHADDCERIPSHTRLERLRYCHPYTRTEQIAVEPVLFCAAEIYPADEEEVFDLTVEGPCHYISLGGIVSKNCFDELPHFSRSIYRFIIGWTRTSIPGQRCRVLATGNPPTTPEGRWVVEEWAPWLDAAHHDPAEPGELRWYSYLDGTLQWFRSGEPFTHKGELIRPRSRTFIPARVQDNPVLMATGYMSTLQAMPEPMRSQLLYGDFTAGTEDSAWQVIPTAWVRAAQDRWRACTSPEVPRPPSEVPLSCLGVDVARGGADATCIASRHGAWFAPLKKYQGVVTDDGPKAAHLVLREHDGRSRVHVDVIGVGSSCYDSLRGLIGSLALPVNVAEASQKHDRSRQYRLTNVRTMMYWLLREALDPVFGDALMLPPDPELLADLCAPTFEVRASGIVVEAKEDLRKRIGRSPDKGDALCLAHLQLAPGWEMPSTAGAAPRREAELPKFRPGEGRLERPDTNRKMFGRDR